MKQNTNSNSRGNSLALVINFKRIGRLTKTSFVFLFFAALVFSSCQKENTKESIDTSNLKATQKSANVLEVTNTSNRNLAKGGTFSFSLKVTNGGSVVKNTVIGIEDPVNMRCAQVTTNNAGIATYTSTIPNFVTAGFYQFKFFLSGNVIGITSTVAVTGLVGSKLSRYTQIPMTNYDQSQTQPNTYCLANRVNNFSSANGATLNANAANTLGRDLLDELRSSTSTKAVLGLGAVSCLATPFFPPAGAVCVASFQTTVVNISVATIKVIAKRGIDRSTLSTIERTNCKQAIDVSTTVLGVATIKFGKGLTTSNIIDANALAWDFGDLRNSNITYDAKGKPIGMSMAATITSGINAGEQCIISFYKK